jgi:hypothetical protein
LSPTPEKIPGYATGLRLLPAEGSILCLSIWDMSRIKWHRDRFLSEYLSGQVDVPGSLPPKKELPLSIACEDECTPSIDMHDVENRPFFFSFFFSTIAP